MRLLCFRILALGTGYSPLGNIPHSFHYVNNKRKNSFIFETKLLWFHLETADKIQKSVSVHAVTINFSSPNLNKNRK